MEKQLLIRLEGLLNNESYGTVYSTLAQYILQNYRKLDRIGISELAKGCHVSVASVSRFVRKLGYQDFFDMKDDLYQLAENETNGLDIFQHLENISSEEYLERAGQNMRKGIEAISDRQLKPIVRDIFSYEQIILMGHWHSGDVAMQMQHDLLYLGRVARTMVRPDEQLEFFQKMPPKVLTIIFSCKGNFFSDFFPSHKIPKQSESSKMYLLTTNSPPRGNGRDVIHLDCHAEDNWAGSNLALFFLEKRIVMQCYQKCYPEGHLV